MWNMVYWKKMLKSYVQHKFTQKGQIWKKQEQMHYITR